MAEYWLFWILYDKWRIFCMLLNFKISFTQDIINASVMFYNFVHESEYCNSDPNLWVDGLYNVPLAVVTRHTNYTSNICDHSASCFYSSVWDTPRQYCNCLQKSFQHKSEIYSLSTKTGLRISQPKTKWRKIFEILIHTCHKLLTWLLTWWKSNEDPFTASMILFPLHNSKF